MAKRFISAKFTVMGDPIGKQSPRMARNGRAYIPAKSRGYINSVTIAASTSLSTPIEGPLFVGISSYKRRPKALCRKKDSPGPIWCPKKPDADNIAKSVLDGLKPWFDDAQVVSLSVQTYYAEKFGDARVVVVVERVSDI